MAIEIHRMTVTEQHIPYLLSKGFDEGYLRYLLEESYRKNMIAYVGWREYPDGRAVPTSS